jgi:hypothetical protein
VPASGSDMHGPHSNIRVFFTLPSCSSQITNKQHTNHLRQESAATVRAAALAAARTRCCANSLLLLLSLSLSHSLLLALSRAHSLLRELAARQVSGGIVHRWVRLV